MNSRSRADLPISGTSTATPGSRRPLGLVLVAVAVWLGCTGFWRPLAIPDEGRYVGVAWEILRSHRWLVPTLDGMPFFHKPPLWYWLSAASMSVLGPFEWAARLPSLMAATCTAGGLYVFLRRWVDEAHALKTLVVLVTIPLYFGAAQYANHDMLVAGLVSLAILAAAHAQLLREAGGRYGGVLLAAYASAALGSLTKGLIGGALPFLVIGAWALVTRRPRRLFVLAWWPGWTFYILITTPWILMVEAQYPRFLDYFFVDQQFRRFAAGGFNNVRDWWFFGAALALLALPWSAWLLKSLVQRKPSVAVSRDIGALMGSWFAVVLVFFSLPQSKLVGYILPALPPLAFLISRSIASSKVLRSSAAVAAAACLSIAIGVSIASPHSAREAARFVRSELGAKDQFLLLDRYVYDLEFYLRAEAPIPVVADWAASSGDGWARELLDSASFDPRAGKRELLPVQGFTWPPCSGQTTWIFADPAAASRHPWLGAPVYRDQELAVWRRGPSTQGTDCR